MIHKLYTVLNWLGSEWVLATLFALSVLAVYVILQRFFELQRLVRASRRFWDEHIESWFAAGDPSPWEKELPGYRQAYPCLEVDALDLIHRTRARKGVDAASAVQAYLDQRRLKLERNVSILGTIGANAPFVGLLGTVLGIIRAFGNMGSQGMSLGMESISGGISEALVATAAGLMVAVPAVVFFNLLNKKITTLIRRAESTSLFVLSEGRTRPEER